MFNIVKKIALAAGMCIALAGTGFSMEQNHLSQLCEKKAEAVLSHVCPRLAMAKHAAELGDREVAAAVARPVRVLFCGSGCLHKAVAMAGLGIDSATIAGKTSFCMHGCMTKLNPMIVMKGHMAMVHCAKIHEQMMKGGFIHMPEGN